MTKVDNTNVRDFDLDLAGKRAVVTGGAGTIGEGIWLP